MGEALIFRMTKPTLRAWTGVVLAGALALSAGVLPISAQTQSAAQAGQAQVQTPPKRKAPEPQQDFTIPIAILALLEALVIGYLIYRIKILQQVLEAERAKSIQSKQQLESQALFDALTQLPNRRLFRDRLFQTMKLASRSEAKFGIMMADLDKFKPINDTLGHEAGDILLKEVSKRLQGALRDSDTVARMGGDEFAFICPSMQDKASASVVCMRILNIMKEPVSILGNDYTVGISLGIAVFPDHAADAEVLVRRADAALYRAKEKRNTFVIFDPKLDLGK
jgi:diguanylate cyclase (GGDEF)-like protein